MCITKDTKKSTKKLKLSEIFDIHEARKVCEMGCRGCVCAEYCQQKMVEERKTLLLEVMKIENVLRDSGYDFQN